MLKSCFETGVVEAGCDEAGRGCLAGPVVAAAVILPAEYKNRILNDSKQLTEKQRDLLEPEIKNDALAWTIGLVDNHEIDRINILNASILAMHRALEKLKVQPQLILVDGNRFKPFGSVKYQCVVKGDATYMSIAAASVLAKTERDRMMAQYHHQFPAYGWEVNKGYPTPSHRKAIEAHGITLLHRKSFRLLPDQLELPF